MKPEYVVIDYIFYYHLFSWFMLLFKILNIVNQFTFDSTSKFFTFTSKCSFCPSILKQFTPAYLVWI